MRLANAKDWAGFSEEATLILLNLGMVAAAMKGGRGSKRGGKGTTPTNIRVPGQETLPPDLGPTPQEIPGGANEATTATPKPLNLLETPRDGVIRYEDVPEDLYERTPENLELMRRNNAPIASDGQPAEWHHDGQMDDGPFRAMTQEKHRGGENFKKNHENTGQARSKVNRLRFARIKRLLWKAVYPEAAESADPPEDK
jgi:hypothetical protein